MDSFLQSIYEMGAGQSTTGAGGGSPFYRPPPVPFQWGGPYPGQMAQAQQAWEEAHAGGQQEEPPPETRRPPPASRRAVRQLPTVTVTPEDLVDESNRECCICLEENHLKDRVIRLPCAHIFHARCITDWLVKSCTCPVCRYELPTDDPTYETHRIERMRARRPRFARYELDRMGARDLRDLASRLRVDLPGGAAATGMEKRDLIGCIVDSGRIEIIAAPEPVEHRLSALRRMGVGELKRAMADAGVFFDPVDVVEKEDMVRIFVNSGRVVLLPEEEGADEGADEGEEEDADEVKDEGVGDEGKEDGEVSIGNASMDIEADEMEVEETTKKVEGNENGEVGGPDLSDGGIHDETQEENEASTSASAAGTDDEESAISAGIDEAGEGNSEGEMEEEADEVPPLPERSQVEESEAHEQQRERQGQHSAFSTRTVSQLRALAREMNVDISDCIEKREMVDRLVDRVASTRLP